MISRKCLLSLSLLTTLLLPLASPAAPLRYTVTVLPFDFVPTDINNAGQISGFAQVSPEVTHAVLLSGGTLRDLGTLGGTNSFANALNEAGDVSGTSETSDGLLHAFLFTNGRMFDIAPPTSPFAIGEGINADRIVVGQFQNKDNMLHAVRYSYRKVKDLGTLGGGLSAAFDINDAGVIVGESSISNEPGFSTFAFVYRNGVMTSIGALADDALSSARQINNCGQIAGYSSVEGGFHVFLYDKGVMRDLGFFGGPQLTVEDMNEQGMIVGTAQSPGPSVGYVYANGQLRDLDTLITAAGWDIQGAHGINDLGQIVATACRENECSTVRLDPVNPIPKPKRCRHARASTGDGVDVGAARAVIAG